MGVTVGEVEAVLKARDIMSPVMVQAAERVKALEFQIQKLGETSGESFDRLNFRLQQAQYNFDQLAQLNQGAVQTALARTQASIQQTATNAQMLGTAVTGSNTALAQTAPAAAAAAAGQQQLANSARVAGQSLGSVENIAMRLVERIVIMYAIRGTFNFVLDLFTAANELQHLSENMEVSTTKLQEWQYAAERSGVPFATLIAAADTLGKKLAKGTDSTVNAVDALGLSYQKLWEMNPADRFDTVSDAVGKVEDRLKRTGIEAELFGTDKIDGLIRHIVGLEEEAEKAGVILGPDTVRSLSQSDDAMKRSFSLFKVYGAEALDYAQRTAAAIALVSMTPFSADAREAISQGFRGSGGSPNAGPGGTKEAPALDLPDQLPKQPLDPNTKEGEKAIDAAAKAIDAATRVAIANEQAAERYTKAWERAEKYVSDLWDNDIKAQNNRVKVKASIEDGEFKQREQRDLKENDRRLKDGIITDQTYYRNKEAIEYTYWQRHNETLEKNKNHEISVLDGQEQHELAKLEEKYATGEIDESQYQQARLAITEEYASKRLNVEDQFNAEMRQRRQEEIDKEVADRQQANERMRADRKKQLAQERADEERERLLHSGGSFEVNRGNLSAEAAYWNIPGSVAEEMAKRGFSFQEIIAAYQSGKIAEWVPRGPRIPGFAEGGTVDVMVGERGPEVARVPIGTNIAPSGYGFGTGVSVNVYVSGIMDPATVRTISKSVSDEIVRVSKRSNQYSSR